MTPVLATIAFASVNTTSTTALASWLNDTGRDVLVVPTILTTLPDSFSTTGTGLVTVAQPAGSTYGVGMLPAWGITKGWTPGSSSTRPTISSAPQAVLVPAGWTLAVYALGLGTISGSVRLSDQQQVLTELSDSFDGSTALPDLQDGPVIDALLFLLQRFLGPQRFNRSTGTWEFLQNGAAAYKADVISDSGQQTVTRTGIESV